MNWISTKDRLPAEGAKTLIFARGEIYFSRFEARAVADNNQVPYGWYGPGPFQFFGQEVSHWMLVSLPEPESCGCGWDPPGYSHGQPDYEG